MSPVWMFARVILTLTHQKRKYIYFKEKLFLPPENGKPTSHAIKRVPQDKNTLMFCGK